MYLAGTLAGASLLTFLAAALASCAARWAAQARTPHAPLRRHLILDPDTPDAKGLMTAFRTAIEDTARTRQALILRICALTSDPRFRPRLNLTPDGDIEVSGVPRKQALQHPGVWIADHPLPLDIPLTRNFTLIFSPCPGARVRVTQDAPLPPTPHIWPALILLIAPACYFNLTPLLAALLAFAGEMHLIRRND